MYCPKCRDKYKFDWEYRMDYLSSSFEYVCPKCGYTKQGSNDDWINLLDIEDNDFDHVDSQIAEKLNEVIRVINKITNPKVSED